MNNNLKLGRLERVTPRTYWQDEARDFTPWLAQEENIALLGDVLGIRLEVQEQEARVGPFRADILCVDADSGDFVLVENQLEQTDHTHLGQLFTYAAGLDAVTVVWITRRFREEHRAAMDWLNRITHEDFRFFGIEVELWRIDDSALAPKLNLVVKPNDWSKTVRSAAESGRTDRAAMYHELWGALIEYVEERSPSVQTPTPSGRHYIHFPLPDAKVNVSYAPSQAVLSLWVFFLGATRLAWSRFIQADADSFARDVGVDFEWSQEEGSDSPWWCFVRFDFDHDQPDGHEKTFGQVASILARLDRALAERKTAFDADQAGT